jgi:sulfur carrier protein ThiS
MANPMIKIFNMETGEEIEREMTAAELAQHNSDIKAREEIQAEREAKEATKAALLDRLGINAEEAALLLG